MMHMNEHGCGKGREAWRIEREAKRAAWRARWAARRATRGDWGHLKDPKFWGLDPESMKQWGMGLGETPGFTPPPSEVEALKAQVAEMETTIGSMQERIAVLERIVLDIDKDQRESRLAAEIEALRERREPK